MELRAAGRCALKMREVSLSVEVYIFHNVGEVFVLLSGNGRVPGSRPRASSHALSSMGRDGWSTGRPHPSSGQRR